MDSIVDYSTALESTLVLENDYITRRLARRAGALIKSHDSEENENVMEFVKRFY